LKEIVEKNERLRLLGLLLVAKSVMIIVSVAFMYKKIKLSVAVTKAAAVFTKEVYSTFFVPIFTLIAVSAILLVFGKIGLYTLSSIEMRHNPASPFGTIAWDAETRDKLLFILFGLIWNYEIAMTICAFIIASSSSMWYFSRSKVQ